MSFTQLNPMISVMYKQADVWHKGQTLAWLDYSQEHDVLWMVANDVTGEVWLVNNKYIRLQVNMSMGRNTINCN